tara:strand:+ start:157 stop:1392 length:1236 start_codon:yes stop_codon:yes gene_type:complete
MKKIPKYLKILFINIILIAYSLELILFFFAPNAQKQMVQINQTRLNIAKDLGVEYDERTKVRAFLDISKNNPNLVPSFYFNQGFSNYETFQKAILLNKPIPFRGPINQQSLSCAEDLNYKLINNDKFGFKNPSNIYEKKIELIVLGDSYAEGQCYSETNDISAYLRKRKFNSANFGVTGSGPLLSLGVLREYAKQIKPDYVFYFYYEGNDITDLLWEKDNILLKKYLNKNFTQNLLGQEDKVKIFLNEISQDTYKYINTQANAERLYKENRHSSSIEHLKDFFELSILKNFIRNTIHFYQDKSFDENLFFSIINNMENETVSWGGKFIFVYTPSWSRYFTRFTKEQRYINKKDLILNNLKKNNINFIDLTIFFDKENNLEQYYPLGYIGHYNNKGYKKIANILADKIDKIK